jgi:Cu/Ag efflux protein CusF
MRKMILSAAAALLLVSATAASADDATGTIQSVDAAKGTITLDNGGIFSLPSAMRGSGIFSLPSAMRGDFRVGQKVKVTYTKNGSEMDVTAITPVT